MDVNLRYDNVLSNNSFTVGATTPVQVSGVDVTLSGVVAGFKSAFNRKFVRFSNVSTGETIFLGYSSSVTAAAGFFKSIAPGEAPYDDQSNGTVPIYAIASAAGATLNMAELQ